MSLFSQLNALLKKQAQSSSSSPVVPDSVPLSIPEQIQVQKDVYYDTHRLWNAAAGSAAARGVAVEPISFAPAYLDSFYAAENAAKGEKARTMNANAKASGSSSSDLEPFSSYVGSLKKYLTRISGL